MSGIVKGAIVKRKLNASPSGGMEPGLTRGVVNQIANGDEAQVKITGPDGKPRYDWHNIQNLELCVAAPASASPSQPAALSTGGHVNQHVIHEGGAFVVSPVSQTERWREIAAGKLLKMEQDLEVAQELLYAEQAAIKQVRLKIENGSLFDA